MVTSKNVNQFKLVRVSTLFNNFCRLNEKELKLKKETNTSQKLIMIDNTLSNIKIQSNL